MKKYLTFFFILGFVYAKSQIVTNTNYDNQNLDDVAPVGQMVIGNGYQLGNAPFGDVNYWNILSMRHGNSANNFTTQLAGEFFGSRLAFRNTLNSSNMSWNEIYHSGNISTLKLALGQPVGGYTLNDVTNNGNFSNKSIAFGNADKLGINWGYNSDSASLYYSNTVNGSGKLMLDIGDDNLDTQAFHIRGVRYDGAINDVAYFNAQGKVGIGTTTPAYPLDVNGEIAVGSHSVNANTTKMFLRNPAGKTWAISSGANMVTESSFSIYNWSDNQSSPFFHIDLSGKIGIGTTNPDSKLTVKGKIHAEEVQIDLGNIPDYVFQKYYTGESELKPDYTLLTLSEIEKFTQENHHLPNVPSAKEIKENGLLLGEMSNILLQKIEELTLYSIDQQKTIDKLVKENEAFKSLSERLSNLENQSKQ